MEPLSRPMLPTNQMPEKKISVLNKRNSYSSNSQTRGCNPFQDRQFSIRVRQTFEFRNVWPFLNINCPNFLQNVGILRVSRCLEARKILENYFWVIVRKVWEPSSWRTEYPIVEFKRKNLKESRSFGWLDSWWRVNCPLKVTCIETSISISVSFLGFVTAEITNTKYNLQLIFGT